MMTVAIDSGAWARLAEEVKRTLGVFVYLAVFFSAFTTYRGILLAEYEVSHYFPFGYGIVEALVLAKVIVFGNILRLGERFRKRPLIIPTLYKTFCFSLLLLAFAVLEHLIGGWIHGRATAAIVNEILDQGRWEILARVLVKVLALVPLFAVWEVGRVLGEGKLFELFFTRRGEANPGTDPSFASGSTLERSASGPDA